MLGVPGKARTGRMQSFDNDERDEDGGRKQRHGVCPKLAIPTMAGDRYVSKRFLRNLFAQSAEDQTT
ncbi:unnamed protein product [Ilex paraguariensis]|uniref:Uncharacterized protein n=1 Tax=Ilex paraguariensis TaxID=185542 RepID=A0ABC8SF57_9AQUA